MCGTVGGRYDLRYWLRWVSRSNKVSPAADPFLAAMTRSLVAAVTRARKASTLANSATQAEQAERGRQSSERSWMGVGMGPMNT